jgi:hypothetical protein
MKINKLLAYVKPTLSFVGVAGNIEFIGIRTHTFRHSLGGSLLLRQIRILHLSLCISPSAVLA